MATAVDPKVKAKTLELIRSWPVPDVADIVEKLQDFLPSKSPGGFRQPLSREGVLEMEGCLSTDRPPPTDEEVERILEEELAKKHLRP